MIPYVFINGNFIAVDKPHGWLTTPARDPADPRPCLGRLLQQQVGQQIYPVHRLDFEVSGLVLFALTSEAHREAQGWFEKSMVQKIYHALSNGSGGVTQDWQEWKSRLVRGKRRSFEASHGKEALTKARIVSDDHGILLWELMPLTGRPHQLRFEMAKHNFSILGDVLYGGSAVKAGWIGLRAVKLDFSQVQDRFELPETLQVANLERP